MMRKYLIANLTEFEAKMLQKGFDRPCEITTGLFLDIISQDIIELDQDELEEAKDTSAVDRFVKVVEVTTEKELQHFISEVPKSSIQKIGEAIFKQKGTEKTCASW